MFVVIFDGFSLEPIAEGGWDVYASSLLVSGYSWGCFSIQGAEGIKRCSGWGRRWDPIQ